MEQGRAGYHFPLDNDLISVSLYKPQLAKNHMQSLASSPLVVERRGRKHTATVLADDT